MFTLQKTVIGILAVGALASQHGLAQHRHDLQGLIGTRLESLVKSRFGQEYEDIAYDLIDSLVGRRDNIFTEYITDPYGTLRACVLFFAHAIDSEDDCVLGIYKDGSILWDSGKILTGYGYSIYAISDVNRDGRVDILITTSSSQPLDIDYMDIFSWDGSSARRINQVDNTAFNLTMLRSGSRMFRLVDANGDGILEIQAYWSEDDRSKDYFPSDPIPTRPWVTYSWNGELYGLWSSTPQVPGATFFPANRLSVRTACRVMVSGDSLEFHYAWSNDPTSEQEMSLFALEGFRSAFNSTYPSGWHTFGIWQDRPVAEWRTDPLNRESNVRPGQTMAGVKITSWGLPAVARFYAQGYRPSPSGETPDRPSIEEMRNDLFTNSFKGHTLGPADPPLPFIPSGFLDSLSSYTTQSRSLGWITSQPVADKYLGYFANARTQLLQNNAARARATLQSVLRDVDVDSSSTLTSEAYALLRFNTVYLIDQLPAQPPQPPFVAQLDSLTTSLTTAYANGWIGDSVFVNSVSKQLAHVRKSLEKGNLTKASAQLQHFLNRIQKVYGNTLERQQKGKPRPKSFLTEEGYTFLTEKTTQLLTRLGSLGVMLSVPGQFATIQAAVNAAKPGTTITVDAGSYNEVVNIQNKDSLTLLSSGKVTIQGARIAKSRVIIVKGFVLDAANTNKDAVQIEGQENADITIEANEIVNSSKHGISAGKHNVRTRIVNNVIANNLKNGIDFADGTDGAQYVLNNTIVKNGWSGIDAASQQNLFLVNNIIAFNGTATGTSGGRYGVKRDGKASARMVTLLSNLIIGNNGTVNKQTSKDIANYQQVLDGTDGNNITTAGTEGVGISSSSNAQFSGVLLPEYRLAQTSIAIDKGIMIFAAPDAEAGKLPEEDKDGNPRPRRTAIDLGAYELE